MTGDANQAHSEVPERIPSVRGIVLTRNARGAQVALSDLRKWLHLNAEHYKTEKLDVFAAQDDVSRLQPLLEMAPTVGQRLSWRTGAEAPPPPLAPLRDLGLHDVFLSPSTVDAPHLDAWLEACAAAELPVRLQVQPPFSPDFDAAAFTARLHGVIAVNLVLQDPLQEAAPPDPEGARTLRILLELAEALRAQGVECNLLQLPFCVVPEDLWPHVLNSPQLLYDHQQYVRESHALAVALRAISPARISKVLETHLGKDSSVHMRIDQRLMPWLLNRPWLYARALAVHKLSRHLNWRRLRVWPLPEGESEEDAQAHQIGAEHAAHAGSVCRNCRFVRICDQDTSVFKQRLPGVKIHALPGEALISPLPLLQAQPKYFDSVDAARASFSEHARALAAEAHRITVDVPPTREIPAESYGAENFHAHKMPGAVQWVSLRNDELLSTPLGILEPPFTLALTFGGGIASHIGFSFGRHAKVVCPMVQYTHRLALHVQEDGRYVLLRDGQLVHPTAFTGGRQAPRRLGGRVEPRIAIWNMSSYLITQTLLVWEHRAQAAEQPRPVSFSVVVVSTCYARRLQAVLLALAHQNIDPAEIEVIVAYVPGIDPTDDLIDSMRHTHPQLRIIRSPFTPQHRRAKGFMINESVKLASGEWIVLLDSDMVLPPAFFEELGRLDKSVALAAPEGRRMLSPAATARILLGEQKSWECYDELLEAEGEYRHMESGYAPIGYCQCVRRHVFDKVSYEELEHFEGSDYYFGQQVVQHFGMPALLKDRPLLHLDHGGSQWYGTCKQM